MTTDTQTGLETQIPSSEAPPAGGGDAKPFYEGWGEDVRGNASIVNAKSAEDVARMYMHAEKRLGVPVERLMTVPDKPDDKAGWDAIYNKLGRPETAEGYQLGLAADATDDDKAFVEGFRAVAHGAGYSQAQVAAAVGYLNQVTADTAKAAQEQAAADAKATQDTLAKEWGAKTDVYKAEIGKLIDELGGEGVVERLNAAGFGDNLDLLRMFAKVCDLRAEPGAPPGNGGHTDQRAMTPDQARAARSALEADPVKGVALRDRTHPQHAVVLSERNSLLAFENPKR